MIKAGHRCPGATIRVVTDAPKGQAVGSAIRITGHLLGVNLAVDEEFTERALIAWASPSLLMGLARALSCSSTSSLGNAASSGSEPTFPGASRSAVKRRHGSRFGLR